MKRFEEIKNEFENSGKYMNTVGYNAIHDLIQMVDLLIKRNSIENGNLKENSIEEDITRVKQRIEDVKEYIEYGLPYSEYLDLENSFDNILSDYKRVLKENEGLIKQIDNYRYFPERLKEEIYKLEDFIVTFKFINNTECYAYKVAKEKLELLKQIYFKC